MISSEKIKEFPLPGEKLKEDTYDIDVFTSVGYQLYKNNQKFIKEHIPQQWHAVIEPISGMIIASPNPSSLYFYTQKRYPTKIMYNIDSLINDK